LNLVEMVLSEGHDVLIIGGGPAGMTAAMWCAELGLNTLLLDEKNELGGQLLWIFNRIDNYPGAFAADGRELRDLFLRSISRSSFETRLNVRVNGIDPSSKQIVLSSGETLSGKAIIVATGVRRRKLGAPGEDEFAGRGVMASGAGEKEKVRDKRVVIVGGGDAALENALILSEFAREVTVVHRRDRFSARGEFVDAARKRKNVRFELQTVVQRIAGNDVVEAIELRNVDRSEPFLLETDNVLIRIGVEPNSGLLNRQIDMDERGYALVDAACRTSISGVFIAGDGANPTSPTIATAVGMGATAAKGAYESLASESK
jgi:thioredoxin reductase (NADPH)